jgi:exopolysaccharide biosynthesis polyprenyl glycosylphosphotransferase
MSTSTSQQPPADRGPGGRRDLFVVHPDARDVRAKRPPLVSLLLQRKMLTRLLDVTLLIALDLGLLMASIVIALSGKSVGIGEGLDLERSFAQAKDLAPFASLVMVLLFFGDGLYRPLGARPGAARIMGSLFKVGIVTLLFAEVNGQQFSSYYIFYSTLLIAAVVIVSARMLYDRFAEFLERAFGHMHRAVIVGTNEQIDDVAAALREEPHVRSRPVGFISLEPRPANGLRDFGSLDEIERHFDEIDEVILADAEFPERKAVDLVDRCHRYGIAVRVAPSTMEIMFGPTELVPGTTMPLIELKAPVFEGMQYVVKRVFDLVATTLLLIPLSLVMVPVALAVKLTSPGPVLYRSQRPGIGGEPFDCFKFRTMRSDADQLQEDLEHMNEADGVLFKIKRDPRLTPIGGFLRRLSLDELPQLLNVIKGDMSLVGPRPLPMRDYDLLDDWHKKRYLVLPGVTGLWQVSGRSELDFDDLVRLDFLYIERWSVWLDIVIMLRTIPAVLRRTGAY